MEKPDTGAVSRRGDRVVIRLRLQPRSSRPGVSGFHAGRIRFAVNAPPVEGAANRELIKALSRLLGVPASSLAIIAGERSRDKDVLVDSAVTEAQILDRMGVSATG